MILARINVAFTTPVSIDPDEEQRLFDEVSELEEEIRTMADALAEKYPGVVADVTD